MVIMEGNIKYSYFRDNFTISYKNEKATGFMPPHTHNAVEIYLNLSYLPSVLLHSKVLPVEKNALIIFPSYSIHQLIPHQNEAYERYVLTVNTIWLNRTLSNNYEDYGYLKDPEHPLIIPVNVDEKARLITCFKKLIRYSDHDTFSKLSCFFDAMSLIHNLFYTLDTSKADSIRKNLSISNKTVNDIIEYINEHIHENIQLMDIANEFYLNPDYISRIFKKYTSITISNYITMQRIGKARKLLTEGESITSTQIKTGFSSYSYFFRVFKKMAGMSPREFKDMYYQK